MPLAAGLLPPTRRSQTQRPTHSDAHRGNVSDSNDVQDEHEVRNRGEVLAARLRKAQSHREHWAFERDKKRRGGGCAGDTSPTTTALADELGFTPWCFPPTDGERNGATRRLSQVCLRGAKVRCGTLPAGSSCPVPCGCPHRREQTPLQAALQPSLLCQRHGQTQSALNTNCTAIFTYFTPCRRADSVPASTRVLHSRVPSFLTLRFFHPSSF